MHVPVRLNRPALLLFDLAVVESVAIEPEPQTRLVLDAEIIARQHRPLRAPPFHGDALGTFGADHGVGGAAPDKARGWAIRHLRDDFYLLRPLEQPQRPQRGLAFG